MGGVVEGEKGSRMRIWKVAWWLLDRDETAWCGLMGVCSEWRMG